MDAIAESFDVQSGVPHRTSAHSTKPDTQDVKKVMAIVMKHKLLTSMSHREHRMFPNLAISPLAKRDVEKTKQWIKIKQKEHLKYKGKFRSEVGIGTD